MSGFVWFLIGAMAGIVFDILLGWVFDGPPVREIPRRPRRWLR
jgi:hypothetical protein